MGKDLLHDSETALLFVADVTHQKKQYSNYNILLILLRKKDVIKGELFSTHILSILLVF